MRKNPPEAKEGKLQEENQLKTNLDAAGNKAVKIVVYTLIVIVVLVILYFVTLQNNDTFRILN